MTNLPGLTPFTEDRPMGARPLSQKFPQQDVRIQAPGLRPAASPVETFARPVAPQRDTQLEQFIDGLSTINPALQRFGSVQRAKDEDTADSYEPPRLHRRPFGLSHAAICCSPSMT